MGFAELSLGVLGGEWRKVWSGATAGCELRCEAPSDVQWSPGLREVLGPENQDMGRRSQADDEGDGPGSYGPSGECKGCKDAMRQRRARSRRKGEGERRPANPPAKNVRRPHRNLFTDSAPHDDGPATWLCICELQPTHARLPQHSTASKHGAEQQSTDRDLRWKRKKTRGGMFACWCRGACMEKVEQAKASQPSLAALPQRLRPVPQLPSLSIALFRWVHRQLA